MLLIITFAAISKAPAAYASIPIETSIYDPADPIEEALKDTLDDEKDGKDVPDLKKHLLHNILGKEYYRNGEFHKALNEFTRAVELDENYASGYNNLGLTYYKLEKYDEAKVAFQNAIKCNETYFEAYNNLGSIFLDEGDLDEAMKNFNRAKELEPESDEVNRNIKAITEIKDARAKSIKILIAGFITGIVMLFLTKKAKKITKSLEDQ